MKKIDKIVAIQGDPLHLINRKTDTTLLLALEAQRRNYKIYYYQTKNLTFSNNKVFAFCKEIEFDESKKKFYTIKNIKKLLLEHKVVFFRNQKITHQEQINLSKCFGPIERHAYVKGIPKYPDILRIVKEPLEKSNRGENCKSDVL